MQSIFLSTQKHPFHIRTSESCKTIAYNKHHRLLCVGPLDETHPLVLFKMTAIEKSDLFLLAAQGICVVLSRIINENMTDEQALLPFKMFHHRFFQFYTNFEYGFVF